MIPITERVFSQISQIAKVEAGLHLPNSKRTFVSSRIQKRLNELQLENAEAYVAILEAESDDAVNERALLVSALTTNVTNTFRESHHFKTLADWLCQNSASAAKNPIKIWSAGCSSGEEPISIAATCLATLGDDWRTKARILATDIDPIVLRKASQNTPPPDIEEQIHSALGGRDLVYFKCGRSMTSLQEGITYMLHNLLDPLPFDGHFDVVFCRNVTIYFSKEVQKAVQELLMDRVARNGMLFIGHSERISKPRSDFILVGPTAYKRISPFGSEVI